MPSKDVPATDKRPYARPTLTRREQLEQVTAGVLRLITGLIR